MSQILVSVIQLCAGPDKAANLQQAANLVKKAAANNSKNLTQLICLPEVFNFRSSGAEENNLAAEVIPGGLTFKWASDLAQELNIWLAAGSILEKTDESFKPFNTSMVFNPAGQLVAKYRKINLFQLHLENTPELSEPTYRAAGNEPITFQLNEFKVGLAICFDLRFPEIFTTYRQLDCDLFLLPSAFTYQTGQAHWQTLCKARAIENQAFLVAANQASQANCWGHSLIVGPWGEIYTELDLENEAVISAELKLAEVKAIRQKLPLKRVK